MNTKSDSDKENPVAYETVKENTWGKLPQDNFGYATDAERRAKRGMEDWEMVEHLPKSQKGVPRWFLAVIVAVLLVAIGLSFPFWGNRPGFERSWVDWGFGAAILYLIVFGTFVYFMVNHYSPSVDGMESDETDPSGKKTTVKTNNSANAASKTEGKQD